MSVEMTFRQKLIRIGCSAAICGLSFSFVVGEAVDAQAKKLHSWINDPYLIPADYLPLSPILGAIDNFKSTAWSENLLAANSLQGAPAPGKLVEPVIEHSQSLLAEVRTDHLKLPIDSSVTKRRLKIVNHPSPKSRDVAARGTKKDDELKTAEIETILGSIHDATAKLSKGPDPVGTEASYLIPGNASPKRSLEQETKGLEPFPMLGDRPRLASTLLVKEKPATKNWAIEGRILLSTLLRQEDGHFEVGLFSKIDSDGNPIGFPLPQQILPTGKTNFRLEIPGKIERGYLFAEFVTNRQGRRILFTPTSNPQERGPQNYAELFYRVDDTVSTVAATSIREPNRDIFQVRGTVSTMFASGRAFIPQQDVIIKVRGRKDAARTDKEGKFVLQLPKMKGTLLLEVMKPGYHPSIVSVSSEQTKPLQIEIASRHAVDQISQRLNAVQGASRGIFLGRATGSDGIAIRGLSAQLSLKADGPFYFNDEGVPTRDLKATGSDGRFIFLNVESGAGYLETNIQGEAIAPLQISSVEGGEVIFKALTPNSGTLRGRIFNPVSDNGKLQPISGARIRVDGASEWVTSDSLGSFSMGPLKWMSGERVSLEVSAEKFFNHRYLIDADQGASSLNLYAFPASYITKLARSMDLDLDPYSGLVIGKVSGPSLRMDALSDHSNVNNARDFYFDARGKLRGSHEMTDPRFGTYIIFNTPKGRTLLQGSDSTGTLRYSEAVFASPSFINIQMD